MKEVSRRNFVKLSAATAGLGLTAGALAGCSDGGAGGGSGAAGGSGEKIKIGVSIWSSTDALGSLSKNILDKAAGILGVELSYVDQGHVSEQVTASIETLCAAGCQGIVVCNSADSEMQAAISTCDQNMVYLAQFYRIINEENSPEVYATAQNSQYYVGAVHEDEVGNGEKLDLSAYNVKGWFYGHWHNHFVRRQGSILTVSTSTPDKGGIDHSTSAFRVVDMDRQGDIKTRLRYVYVDHSVRFASIANDRGTYGPDGRLLLSVNAYDTTAPLTGLACTLTDDGGNTLLRLPLSQKTDWNWLADCRLPEACRNRRVFVTAEARFADGTVTKEHASFVHRPAEGEPHIGWMANIGANILYAAPVVDGGKVFVASLDEDLKGEGAVHALDAATGRLLWRCQVRNSVKNTIACHDGTVFAQDAEGYLYAIDAATGRLRWEKKLVVDGLPLLSLLWEAGGLDAEKIQLSST